MRTTLKSAALAALVGLGALTGLASTASADNLYLGFGDSAGRGGLITSFWKWLQLTST